MITDVTDGTGKLLASPYLDKVNNESGDKCFYTLEDKEMIWTEKCQPINSGLYSKWSFIPVITGQFQLVNNLSKRCAKPISNFENSAVRLVPCTTDNDMIWTLFDGL